jgi:hypothetical protein
MRVCDRVKPHHNGGWDEMTGSLLKSSSRPSPYAKKCPRTGSSSWGERDEKRVTSPLSKREAELGCASPRLSDTPRDAPRLRPPSPFAARPRASRYCKAPQRPSPRRCNGAAASSIPSRTLRAQHVNRTRPIRPCASMTAALPGCFADGWIGPSTSSQCNHDHPRPSDDEAAAAKRRIWICWPPSLPTATH